MCRCADGQVFPLAPPPLTCTGCLLFSRPHLSGPTRHFHSFTPVSLSPPSVVVLFLPLPAPALLDDPQPRSPSQQSPLLSFFLLSLLHFFYFFTEEVVHPSFSRLSSSDPPDLTPRRNLSRVPLVPGLPGKSGQALSSPPIPRAIPQPHLHKHVPQKIKVVFDVGGLRERRNNWW